MMVKQRIIIAVVAMGLILWQLSDAWKNYYGNDYRKPYVDGTSINKKAASKSHKRAKINLDTVAQVKAEFRNRSIPVSLEDIKNDVSKDDDAGPSLLRAIDLLKKDEKTLAYISESYSNFNKLTAEQKNELREFLNSPDLKDVFSLLEQASKKSSADFNIDYSKGFATLLPHLGSLRNFSQLLSLQAKLGVEDGHAEDAVKSLNTGFRLAEVTNDRMTLIGELVHNASMNILFDSLKDIRADAAGSGKTYEILEQQLLQVANGQIHSMDSERILFGGDFFEKALKSPETLSELGVDENIKNKLTPEVLEADYKFYMEYMLSVRNLMEDPQPGASVKLQEMEQQIVKNKDQYPITSMIAPSYTSIFDKYQEHQSRMKMNLIALKLEEYRTNKGSYPTTLTPLNLPDDILIDNQTGKPYSLEGGAVKSNFKNKLGKSLEIKVGS